MALQSDKDGFLVGGTPVALDKEGFRRAYDIMIGMKKDVEAIRKALVSGTATVNAATPTRRSASVSSFTNRQAATIAKEVGDRAGRAVAVTRARDSKGRFIAGSSTSQQAAAVVSASTKIAAKIAQQQAAQAKRDGRGRFTSGGGNSDAAGSEGRPGLMRRMFGRFRDRFGDAGSAAGEIEDTAATVDPGAAAAKETRELLSPFAKAGASVFKLFGGGKSEEEKAEEKVAKKVHVPWYKKLLKAMGRGGAAASDGIGGILSKIPGIGGLGSLLGGGLGMIGKGGMIGAAAMGGWEIGSMIYEKFAPEIGEIVDKSVAFAQGAWDTVTKKWDDVVKGWNSLTSDIGNKWTAITDAIGEKFGIVKDVAVKAYEGAVEKTSQAIEKVANAPSTAKEWVGEKYDAAKDSVASAFGGGSKGNKLALQNAMLNAGIKDPTEQAMFMSQMHTETGGFRNLEENLNYSPKRLMEVFPGKFKSLADAESVASGGKEAIGNRIYGGRMGNAADEGFKYRGRGFTHLTGKANYQAASNDLGLDLVNNPDLAADPAIAGKIATWYWQKNGIGAAAKSGDVKGVTKKINGGFNGLADRQQQFASYSKSGAVTNADIQALAKYQSAALSSSSMKIPAVPPSLIAANAGKESRQSQQVVMGNTIGQNMADRAIAHVATGGMASNLGT